MSDATFTFRVDDALKKAFTHAAKSKDRTGAQLLRDFMRSYVSQETETDTAAYDAWFRRQVEVGMISAKNGHLVPNDEVEAKFAKKRAATRRRMEVPE